MAATGEEMDLNPHIPKPEPPPEPEKVEEKKEEEKKEGEEKKEEQTTTEKEEKKEEEKEKADEKKEADEKKVIRTSFKAPSMSMIHDTHNHFPKMTFKNLLGNFYVFQSYYLKLFFFLQSRTRKRRKRKLRKRLLQ